MAQNLTMEHNPNMRAWVAFTDESDLGFLRWMKKGFKHCFVIIHDGERWMTLDPLSNHLDIVVHEMPSGFDFPAWLSRRGYTIEKAQINRNHMKMAPILPFTCVEAVKRFLGIHAWNVWTPWQLCTYLRDRNSNAAREININKENFYGQSYLVA